MHLTRNLIPSLGCALALAVAPLFAQTAVTPPAAKAAEEEKLILSPFEVVSNSDVGYLATNSTSATRFNVQSRDLSISIQTITSGTSYVDNQVTAGTTYWYRVSANNANGTGAPSNEASATPRKGR